MAVGPPLGFWSNLLLGGRAAWDLLAASPVPKLTVCGDADNFTSIAHLRGLVQQHNRARGASDGGHEGCSGRGAAGAEGQGGGRMRLEVLAGADHFYAGRWAEVAGVVVRWLLQVEEERSHQHHQQQGAPG